VNHPFIKHQLESLNPYLKKDNKKLYIINIMSAGGLSYSGITNYGKITLPSVEAGLGSMNILRDPPKSIHTRRINKVGETSSITELIDQSGSRACEAISVYSRGINPMVSVDYGNSGNNGGQRVSGGGLNAERGSSGNAASGSGQAYLPYRVARDGAFRPPVMRQEQLMPLSRQPRTNTQAFTKRGFVDYSKKLVCPGGNYRAVKQKVLTACVRPTATYRIDSPLIEPFEVKYVIKNPTKFDPNAGVSGRRTQDLTQQIVSKPIKGINTAPLQPEDVYANQSGKTVRYVDHSHMNTERYIQDTLHSSVKSKISQSIQMTPIEDIIDIDTSRYIQDTLHSSVKSNISQSAQMTPIEDIIDIDTSRYIQDTLHSSVKSNISQSAQMTPIEDIIDVDTDNYTKNPLNVSYTAPKTGHSRESLIHKDIKLQRRVLAATMATNKHRNIYSRPQTQHQAIQKRNRPIARVTANHGTIKRQSSNDINSREYKLHPTINAGGFEGRGQQPNFDRNQRVNENFVSDKMKMSKRVMQMQVGRNFPR
jgi:hypothetical protein